MTELVWITPNADELIGYIARVSNPKAQKTDPSERLIRYLITHKHWSPFEMASACFKIETTRTIGRQILRHRSFSFQEFSQRYSDPRQLGSCPIEFRKQAETNRQSSTTVLDPQLHATFTTRSAMLNEAARALAQEMLEAGVAKECTRMVLPEGMTPTVFYMSGTIRSWIHYLDLRTEDGTQKEHREIAQEIDDIFWRELPATWEALRQSKS